MFRSEPSAAFRTTETSRPDPNHPGISFVDRSFFLSPGPASADVELSRSFGEAIAAGQQSRPQPMGRAADRYWWLYRDRVYSTPDRLSRAAVLRLAEREREVERERRAAAMAAQRPRGRMPRGDHATA